MRFALRSLLRTPGFTVVALLTLALGIGLNTAMFSLLNTFLLRPLPFPESERLFQLYRADAGSQTGGHSAPNFRDIQEAASDVADLALLRTWGYTLAVPGRPAGVFNTHRVSTGVFDVLGVQPQLGRFFRAEEDAPGANHVIVISHSLWTSYFDADPQIVGRIVRLDGQPTEIVGVLPEQATVPSLWGQVWIYRPLGLVPEELNRRLDNQFQIIGRYRAGVDPAAAHASLDAIAARLAADHPLENPKMGLRAVSLKSTSLDPQGRSLTFLLLALSGFVLLIACANLANLMLARALARAREFAIRAALGATRHQLIRPLVSECLLLAAGGTALGVLVAAWTTDLLSRRLSGDDAALEFAFDFRVLAFAVGAAVVTSLLFGVVPAWIASHVRVNETLKSGARGATGDRSHQRLRQVLIVGQFALALVLLAGAAVMVRGLDQLIRRDAGWRPAGLVTGKLAMPTSITADSDRTLQFYQQLQERLAALPGVEGVSVDVSLPLSGYPGPLWFEVEGRDPAPPGRRPMVRKNPVSPEFFGVTGIALRQGRTIAATDRRDSPAVAVINTSMARAVFPDGDAIGQRLRLAGQPEGTWIEIVGVVDDVRFLTVNAEQTPFQLYIPLSHETWGYVSVTARARNPEAAAALAEPMRRVVAELDADLAFAPMPIPDVIERTFADIRFIGQLLTGFALLGLFLAALGIYGVTSRAVLQRTPEIGIRLALGAQWHDITRLIVGGGAKLAIVGALLGLVFAAVLTTFLMRAMPGLAAGHAPALAGATVVLVGVSLLACWLPARRATRVDPLTALRAE
jgi:putative ABC transport system permease protein